MNINCFFGGLGGEGYDDFLKPIRLQNRSRTTCKHHESWEHLDLKHLRRTLEEESTVERTFLLLREVFNRLQ